MLAFTTANGDAAGLIDDDRALLRYAPALINAIAGASQDASVQSRARGFMVDLEKALKEPSEKTRIVDYPPRANAELLRITAVVPAKGLEALPIPVCAEQHNKVVGTWNITPKGEVVPAPWTGQRESETPTSAACKGFILAARADINSRVAQQSNPPSRGAPQQ